MSILFQFAEEMPYSAYLGVALRIMELKNNQVIARSLDFKNLPLLYLIHNRFSVGSVSKHCQVITTDLHMT